MAAYWWNLLLKKDSINQDQKAHLFEQLQGHFAELALDVCGSFCVQTLYTKMELNFKEKIVEELMEISEQLAAIKHGSYLIKCCRLDIFASNRESWIFMEQKAKRKNDMLSEFLPNKKNTKTTGRKNSQTPKQKPPGKTEGNNSQTPKQKPPEQTKGKKSQTSEQKTLVKTEGDNYPQATSTKTPKQHQKTKRKNSRTPEQKTPRKPDAETAEHISQTPEQQTTLENTKPEGKTHGKTTQKTPEQNSKPSEVAGNKRKRDQSEGGKKKKRRTSK